MRRPPRTRCTKVLLFCFGKAAVGVRFVIAGCVILVLHFLWLGKSGHQVLFPAVFLLWLSLSLSLCLSCSLSLSCFSLSLSLSFVRDSCLTLFTLRCVAYIFVSSSSIEEDDTKKLRRDRITQKLLKLRKYSISCSELLRKFVCPDFYTPISTRRPPGRSPVLRKPSGAAAVAVLLLRQ